MRHERRCCAADLQSAAVRVQITGCRPLPMCWTGLWSLIPMRNMRLHLARRRMIAVFQMVNTGQGRIRRHSPEYQMSQTIRNP